MAQTYEEAQSVESIANSLIGTHHPELAEAKFRYIFKEKCSKKGGKTVLGTVKKMSDLQKFLITGKPDFLIEIPLDAWNELDASRRTALVDHLLERCTGEEDEQTAEMKWKTREPDVYEFSSILRRHGAWTEDLSNFASVAQSLDLSFMTEEEDSEVQTAASE
jgi:Putative phage metallopeptidase